MPSREYAISPCRRRPNSDPAVRAVILDTSDLFAGRQEVVIRHAGQLYRLRLTRNGKLILNK